MKRANLGGLLLAALLLGGCSGRELLAGGQAEVEAAATDDAEGTSGSRTGEGIAFSTAPAAVPSGTLEITASVSLLDANGGAIAITEGFSTVQLGIAESDTVRLGRETVPSGTYSAARIVLSRVTANVTGGLLVDGVPLLGEVHVAIGSEPLVIEAPVLLVARQGELSTLVVDLNAAAWLSAADPLTRLVPAAALRAAVEASAR